MENIIKAIIVNSVVLSSIVSYDVVAQTQQLSVVYPPENHETTAAQIFLIGTASPEGEVLVNGERIKRSPAGHFAPSFPLELGENTFQLLHKDEELTITVTRNDTQPTIPTEATFAENSLTPSVDITKLPGETICFSAVAPPAATVSVTLPGIFIPLLPEIQSVTLPPNSEVLIGNNAPSNSIAEGKYRGCHQFEEIGNFGKPRFELNLQGKRYTQEGKGEIIIAAAEDLEVVEVIEEGGIARTGASTNYSRLTPLPKGTRAKVKGKEGEWLRLDYGGWIKAEETQSLPSNTSTQSLIRSITSRQ